MSGNVGKAVTRARVKVTWCSRCGKRERELYDWGTLTKELICAQCLKCRKCGRLVAGPEYGSARIGKVAGLHWGCRPTVEVIVSSPLDGEAVGPTAHPSTRGPGGEKE